MSAAIDNEDLQELSMSTRRGNASAVKTVDFSADAPVLPVPQIDPNKARDSKASQRLGQYTIAKTLGEGSFGKVKLATHQVSGQKVALKIINRKRLVTRDMAGRIEREISYLQLLRHPHIIKLYVADSFTLPMC
jgi:carbon catabolite-derepressing protein kinase